MEKAFLPLKERSNLVLKLKKQFFVFSSLSFFVILAFAIGLNKARKTELAQTVFSQVKENLLLRNHRPVFISLEAVTKGTFSYIRFSDFSGKQVFTIPSDFEMSGKSLFIQTISIPIYLESTKKTIYGFLEFGYSVLSILIFALVFWGLFILSGYIILLRYEKLLLKEQEYLLKIRNAEFIHDLAKQVSHDIRSPLSALNMLMAQIQNIPENQRVLVRNSVNRITDVANTLLQKSNAQRQDFIQDKPESGDQLHGTSAELLPAIIETIVSEKRLQFRDKTEIEIMTELQHSYGSFARIEANELKRALSNLINNSVEACIEGKGKVKVIISVLKNLDSTAIIVNDNGKGIPQDIIANIGEKGMSYGKVGTQSGSGLGVYHAKSTVEKFGGRFNIDSKTGHGTTITLTFPATNSPQWFVEKLILLPNMQVVSLDDDLAIHEIWKNRFYPLTNEGNEIEHLVFASGSEFRRWYKMQEAPHVASRPKRLYLFDFELMNQNETGLTIISALGLASEAILVTSQFEEPKIREDCIKLGLKLLPKEMVPFVPIEVSYSAKSDDHF